MVFKLWFRKAAECSEMNGLFYGSLEDKRFASSADDGSLCTANAL